MILEIFLVLSVAFLITVWFYKQRRDSLEILQVEFSAAANSLADLAQEGQPIVIRGAPFPPSLTRERLVQIPRLDGFPLKSGGPVLKDYRDGPAEVLPGEQALGLPILSREASIGLAKELAVDTWVNHTLREFLGEFSGMFGMFHSHRVSCILGGVGLRRGVAVYTCIMPTDGVYTVSLVNSRSESFLPAGWKYRYPQSFTVNDTPLVGEIQFIDIVVRPGTVLAIPAHCLYALQPKSVGEFHSAVVLEVDSPVSTVAAALEAATD